MAKAGTEKDIDIPYPLEYDEGKPDEPANKVGIALNVRPANPGNQSFSRSLDPGFRRGDDCFARAPDFSVSFFPEPFRERCQSTPSVTPRW